jgi:hypothetical protein
MSALNYIIEKLKAGAITFINAVTLANRDYPYHDALTVSAGSTGLTYVVGQGQIDAHGNQSKRFVSKSTLIMSTADTNVKFNDSKNVDVPLVANVWYEFKSNIWQVFYTTPASEKYVYFYFEGVLPEEARSPR